MTNITTKPDSLQPEAETSVYLFDNWFDPIEAGLRDRVLSVDRHCSLLREGVSWSEEKAQRRERPDEANHRPPFDGIWNNADCTHVSSCSKRRRSFCKH